MLNDKQIGDSFDIFHLFHTFPTEHCLKVSLMLYIIIVFNKYTPNSTPQHIAFQSLFYLREECLEHNKLNITCDRFWR